MNRKLVYYPNEVLRLKAHEVRDFNRGELLDLATEMRQIMKQHNGMGLAANQVGDLRRVIIVELPEDKQSNEPGIPFTILVNPKITNTNSKTDKMSEGCLSVPAVEIEIERPTEVTVMAQSIAGEPLKIRAKGIFARILQHEIDHLNGVLITDYAKEATQGAIKTMVWGSTAFTTAVSNVLLRNQSLKVTHFVTEAPKPSGRGKEVTPTIVKKYADTLNIPCLEPESIQDERFLSYIHTLAPDLIIVAAYGKLLPNSILELPKYGCINVHPSLLPKYRGATPIQAAILNGDKQTGVTVMKMSPQFDTGDSIAQSVIDLDGTETYGDLESYLAELGGEVINEVLQEYIQGNLEPMPQEGNLASYAKKYTAEDRWLDLDKAAQINERKVRAYAPSPGAFVILDGQRVKVLQVHIQNNELIFDTVQPAGKKPMSWEDFKRGYKKSLVFDTYSP